jgi:hypothetical protein
MAAFVSVNDLGNGLAQAAGCANDQGDLALNSAHHPTCL